MTALNSNDVVAPTTLRPDTGIVIREATPADNSALLALTEATPMAGHIALRLDRRPDFFALLKARGEPKMVRWCAA